MGSRGLLVALVVLATAAFVVGATIERNTGESGHHDAARTVAPASGEAAGAAVVPTETGGDSAAEHAKETGAGSTAATGEAPHAEFRLPGINIEASSFWTSTRSCIRLTSTATDWRPWTGASRCSTARAQLSAR